MNTEKLRKLLLLMLSSDQDGEALNAARALRRRLEADSMDIHEFADLLEGRKLSEDEMKRIYERAFEEGKNSAAVEVGFSPAGLPSFYEMACEIQHKANGRLSPKEEGFIEDMVRWCARREPSEKQAKWLHSIYCKIGRRE
jgi:hypothetical protein